MPPSLAHEYFMEYALKEAQKAYDENEVPIGAIVVFEEKIISKAYNQVEKLHDPTAHAEILAITSACYTLGSKYLTQCSLYITVEPCMMCAGAVFWSKVNALFYGAGDNQFGFTQKSNGKIFHEKMQVQGGILENKCRELMLQFFAEKRK